MIERHLGERLCEPLLCHSIIRVARPAVLGGSQSLGRRDFIPLLTSGTLILHESGLKVRPPF